MRGTSARCAADTTPAQWFAVESEVAPPWEPLADLRAWAGIRSAARDTSAAGQGSVLWAGPTLLGRVAVLLWRLHRGGGIARARKARSIPSAPIERTGSASPFIRIEYHLARHGLPRRDSETHAERVNRVRSALPKEQCASLCDLSCKHYRWDSIRERSATRRRSASPSR